MAISLYQLTVPNYLQTLGAVEGFMAKGLAFCQERGIDPQTVVDTRLFDDMLPFRFQIQSVAHHSLGAIRSLKTGVFSPGPRDESPGYAQLQQLVADTRTALEQITAAEVNAHEGGEIRFVAGERNVPYVTEDFVQSFSLPNFYFHATTAYDILRHLGVGLGKRDYLGRLRIKT